MYRKNKEKGGVSDVEPRPDCPETAHAGYLPNTGYSLSGGYICFTTNVPNSIPWCHAGNVSLFCMCEHV